MPLRLGCSRRPAGAGVITGIGLLARPDQLQARRHRGGSFTVKTFDKELQVDLGNHRKRGAAFDQGIQLCSRPVLHFGYRFHDLLGLGAPGHEDPTAQPRFYPPDKAVDYIENSFPGHRLADYQVTVMAPKKTPARLHEKVPGRLEDSVAGSGVVSRLGPDHASRAGVGADLTRADYRDRHLDFSGLCRPVKPQATDQPALLQLPVVPAAGSNY